MARKLARRSLRRLARSISKVQARKHNPPTRGLKRNLADANRPILEQLSKALAKA